MVVLPVKFLFRWKGGVEWRRVVSPWVVGDAAADDGPEHNNHEIPLLGFLCESVPVTGKITLPRKYE
jgi:hypothetical protein